MLSVYDLEHFDQVCLDFLKDSDTYMNIDSMWYDCLYKEYILPECNDAQQVVRKSLEKYVVNDNQVITVLLHNAYINENINVYVAFDDGKVKISTKDWLLS